MRTSLRPNEMETTSEIDTWYYYQLFICTSRVENFREKMYFFISRVWIRTFLEWSKEITHKSALQNKCKHSFPFKSKPKYLFNWNHIPSKKKCHLLLLIQNKFFLAKDTVCFLDINLSNIVCFMYMVKKHDIHNEGMSVFLFRC